VLTRNHLLLIGKCNGHADGLQVANYVIGLREEESL